MALGFTQPLYFGGGSPNPIGLHGLLQGQLYFFYFFTYKFSEECDLQELVTSTTTVVVIIMMIIIVIIIIICGS
jgi:hypothetical protein